MRPNQRQPKPAIPSLERIGQALAPILEQGGAAKAVVFGSYARGAADEHSDLDLIIVAETARTFLQRHKDFPGIYHVWHKGLDMLIYTPGELSQMLAEGNAFIERALKEGVVIYEKQ